ncbi:TLD-domain-containing protein [Chlamydoabsidia padenii]|nr:TLD-domain-containing protein [Chlamydoabsidia padenii]
MKHQHHRGASTCSTKPLTETTKDGYIPLHRSITDDHEDKHAKHHYDTGKSPITRFVCKLLGLEPSKHNISQFGHKSGSTTSITKSSVFHFSTIPSPPPSSSTLSDQTTNTSSYFINKKKQQTKKKKKSKNGDDDNSCSSISSSSSYSSSTLSTLSSLLSGDQNITTQTTGQNDHAGILTHHENDYDEKRKSIILPAYADKSHPPWNGVTPAMDALVMASQIPSVKKIHFVDDFEIPPPTLTNRHPSTYPLLTSLLSEQLRPYLPRRYRLASEWCLLYSLDQHGASLSTLYQLAKDSGPCILILKDDEQQIFGAYLNESIRLDLSYYGTGECFLWKIPPPTNNPSSSGSPPSNHHHPTPKIKVFPWTGKNEYMIYSTVDCIALGGGGGKFGLWINQDLEKGHSEPCATFDNECLSLNPLFNCVDLEIWSFRI